jgi:hypothetical protein
LRKRVKAIGRDEILSFEDNAVLNVRYVFTAGLRRERKFVRQASHIYLGAHRGALSGNDAIVVVSVVVGVR